MVWVPAHNANCVCTRRTVLHSTRANAIVVVHAFFLRNPCALYWLVRPKELDFCHLTPASRGLSLGACGTGRRSFRTGGSFGCGHQEHVEQQPSGCTQSRDAFGLFDSSGEGFDAHHHSCARCRSLDAAASARPRRPCTGAGTVEGDARLAKIRSVLEVLLDLSGGRCGAHPADFFARLRSDLGSLPTPR